MRLRTKTLYSIAIALIIFFLSMFANIIPCQTAPSVPNPSYQWMFCNINPDIAKQSTLSVLYFGYLTSLTQTYFVILIICFLAAMIVLHFIAKNKTILNK